MEPTIMSKTPLSHKDKSTNDRSFYKRLAPLRWIFRKLGTVAPKTTGRIALRLFRSPHAHSTPARELQWLESADRFEFEVGGETLVGWSWGSGPTVLLVHGWEGRGSQMGAFAQPLVEAGHRVVTFDGPAHGRSTGKLSSLPQFAAAIRQLADQIGPLHGIVAHSFGSPATALAMQQGMRADRLAFIAPPADLDEYIDYFCALLGFSKEVRSHMIDHLEQSFDLRWDDVRMAPLQPQAQTELLVIHDRDDQDSAFANGQRVAAAWPASRLHPTSGLGHRRILRNRAVVSRVVDFLSQVPAARVNLGIRRSAA
jgi:pimeloyl-ACP methyl ester carboxylesterase